jgi:hypothetical protein
MKRSLKGKRFRDVDEVKENTLKALSSGKSVGTSALMHMDYTLKGTNIHFNKKAKIKNNKNKFRLFLGSPSYKCPRDKLSSH